MNPQDYSPGVQQYIERGQRMLQAEAQAHAAARRQRFNTIAVHGLYDMEAAAANQGSIIEPGYFATSQHFENSDHMEAALSYLMPAWAYARIANPTQYYLEQTLALLESYGFDGEASANATGSGMAACFMATYPFLTAHPSLGDAPNIVASAKCYGGTFMLFAQRYTAEMGVELRWVADPLDLAAWERSIDEHTRFVYGEMPSNPGLGLFDIEKVAALAHAHGAPLIVDSTIASPALLRPLRHGADVVVHSTSKIMNASGFGIGGALIARHNLVSHWGTDEMRANFALWVKGLPFRDFGPTLSPFNALMTLNELRTLRAKADQFSRSALEIAVWLSGHPAVESVGYPGLPTQPGYELASRYLELVDADEDYGRSMHRYGHLLSFNVKGGASAARAAFDRLRMIWRATDLGRIKTVATIPTISTHQQQGEEGRTLAGIPANLIRLSVGGEHPADIIADLDQALQG